MKEADLVAPIERDGRDAVGGDARLLRSVGVVVLVLGVWAAIPAGPGPVPRGAAAPPGAGPLAAIGPGAPLGSSVGVLPTPDGTSPAVSANWTNLSTPHGFTVSTLTPRLGASFAYSESDRMGVLFGGRNLMGFYNQTFSYAGQGWTQYLTASAPSPRAYAAMAYDPVSQNVVLFGGLNANGILLNDTWTYFGGNWMQQNVTSPPARANASLAWDATDSRLILFGGESSHGLLGDTWEWGGLPTGWTNETANATPGPSPRESAVAAPDVTGGGVLLFGGWNGSTCANDTWVYVGGRWTESSPTPAPSARCGAAMAFDSESNADVLFGGRSNVGSGTLLNDTWGFDGTNWTQLTLDQAPSPRYGADLIDCLRCNALGLFGGSIRTVLAPVNDTWQFLYLTAEATAVPSATDAPARISFFATAAGGTSPYRYAWNLGDGNASNLTNPMQVYSVPAVYVANVTVTDSAGLTTTARTEVVVTPPPKAGLTAAPLQGPAPLTVNFTGRVTGGAPPFHYYWNFGDGSTSTAPNVTHTFLVGGNYSVGFVVTDRFSVPASTGVWVDAYSPLVASALASVTGGDAPLNVTFQGGATGGVPPYAFAWEFGDGTSSVGTQVTHRYTGGGNVTATLTVTDALAHSARTQLTVDVRAPLSVQIRAVPSVGPIPLVVQFNATPSGGAPPYVLRWAFGDGGTSSLPDPVHEYYIPRTWNATVTVTDSYGSTTSATEVVTTEPSQAPVSVQVTANPVSGPAPLNVAFLAQVGGGSGPYTEVWEFGDGSSASGLVASHTYTRPSQYTATLVVTDGAHNVTRTDISIDVTGAAPPPTAATELQLAGVGLLVGGVAAAGVAVGVVLRRRRRRSRGDR